MVVVVAAVASEGGRYTQVALINLFGLCAFLPGTELLHTTSFYEPPAAERTRLQRLQPRAKRRFLNINCFIVVASLRFGGCLFYFFWCLLSRLLLFSVDSTLCDKSSSPTSRSLARTHSP